MTPDLSPYEQWQLEHYGNIEGTCEPGFDGEYEQGENELRRLEEYNHLHSELEMIELVEHHYDY